jgi:hexosaminidase
MRVTKRLIAALFGMALSSTAIASKALAADQAQVDAFAAKLGYRFTVLTNHTTESCTPPANCFMTEIALTLPDTVPDGAWALYVGLPARLNALANDDFDFVHLQGDIYRVTPKPGRTLQAGATYRIREVGAGHFESPYFVLPNVYVAVDGLKPAIIAATRPVIDPETGQEQLPFVTPFTDEAQLAHASARDQTQWLTPQKAYALNASRQAAAARPEFGILPTPVSVRHLPGKPLDLTRGIALKLTGLDEAAVDKALKGFKVGITGVLVDVLVDGRGAPESYHLTAGKGRVRITAADSAGAFYALQSLSQESQWEHGRLRPLTIDDAPRYGFRGLHLDLARNFLGKAYVLKTIAVMGQYKLNRLHLHLADDEGWRVQIDGLPELTDIGSRRCFDLTENQCLLPQLGAGPFPGAPVNGYLTRADYIEILKAAAANHIEVIPSFDMPGHSRAAVRSMEARYRKLTAAGQTDAAAEYRLVDPQDASVYASIQNYSDNTLNVCEPSTYHFVEKIIDTIAAYHREAGVPLRKYHIGGDETAGAWKASPACDAMKATRHLTTEQLAPYFLQHVIADLKTRGIEPAAWGDGLSHVDPAAIAGSVQSNAWGLLLAGAVPDTHRQIDAGWQVVLSSPETLYFDMPNATDPAERGYDWASRGTDLFKVFAFLPDNLPANAVLMTDLDGKGVTINDTVPLTAGHHVEGMQGQLWSETIRSSQIADYMLFPRTLALAERAWHAAAWEPAYVPGKSYSYGDPSIDRTALNADWTTFQARLVPALDRLTRDGIAWRLPAPGARIEDGKLEANLAIDGPAILYKAGTGAWQTYTGPIAVSGLVQVRAAAGGRLGRVVQVSP